MIRHKTSRIGHFNSHKTSRWPYILEEEEQESARREWPERERETTRSVARERKRNDEIGNGDKFDERQ